MPVATGTMTEQEKKNFGIGLAEERFESESFAPNIEEIRRWARWFIYSNQSMPIIRIPNVVWADPVRDHFRPESGKNNWMGGLFRGRIFVKVKGEGVASKTEGSHGREVKLWTLKEYLKTVTTAIESMMRF